MSPDLPSPPSSPFGAAAVLADLDAGDEALPLARAGHAFPARVAPQSVYRYCHRGHRGVRLEAARLPHRLVVTRRSIRRFLDRLNGTGGPPASPAAPPSPASYAEQHKRAEAELAAAGI